MAEKTGFKFKVKEFFRKRLVSIKRNPQNIALIVLVASFLTYSLSLTKFSNTTAKLNVTPMGLCEFVSMLFSILIMVCFLNSFPKRKKVKWVMVGIMFAMMAAIVAVDVVYYITASKAYESQIATKSGAELTKYLDEVSGYVNTSLRVIIAQIVLLGVAALLVAFLPLYRPLLKKINTSIEVEGNDDMETIELQSDEE